ncbi:hypothetical protein D3C87_1175330 [compost metagenome]
MQELQFRVALLTLIGKLRVQWLRLAPNRLSPQELGLHLGEKLECKHFADIVFENLGMK